MGAASRRKAKRHEHRESDVPARNILVRSTAGTCFVERNSKVLVRATGNELMEKTASTLKPGEQVVWEIEAINLNEQREALEEGLRRGSIFKTAMEGIYVSTEDGETLPIFTIKLWAGADEKPHAWPEEVRQRNIADRILSGESVNDEMCRVAAKAIHYELAKNLAGKEIHIVTESTVRDWLCGRTIAPDNFRFVFEAIDSMAPNLGKLNSDERFESAYWMYRAMKLSLATRLREVVLGNKTVKQKKETHCGTNHLTRAARAELDTLVENFAEVITKVHATANVLEVREISGSGMKKIEAQGKNRRPLRRGLVTQTPPELRDRVLDPIEANSRLCLTEHLKTDILQVQAVHERPGEFDELPAGRVAATVSGYWFDLVIERFGYVGYSGITKRIIEDMEQREIDTESLRRKHLDPEKNRSLAERAGRMHQWLVSGDADSEIGLDLGTCMRIINMYIRHLMAVPINTRHYALASELLENMLAKGETHSKMYKKIAEEARRTYEKEIRSGRVILRTPAAAIAELATHESLLGFIEKSGIFDADTLEYFHIRGKDDKNDRIIRRIFEVHPDIMGGTLDTFIFKDRKEAVLRRVGLLEAARKIEEKAAAVRGEIVKENKRRMREEDAAIKNIIGAIIFTKK